MATTNEDIDALNNDAWVKQIQPDDWNQLLPRATRLLKIQIAECKDTPASTLVKLAIDSDERVRRAVAKNKNTPARNSGCFIATAATGSYEHPMVMDLRVFRDQVLESSRMGRKAIQVYYLSSPAVANVISQSRFLRCFVKWTFVAPLAWIDRAFNMGYVK